MSQLTNKFSRLFNTELVTVSKWPRSKRMTVNASVSHTTYIVLGLYTIICVKFTSIHLLEA